MHVAQLAQESHGISPEVDAPRRLETTRRAYAAEFLQKSYRNGTAVREKRARHAHERRHDMHATPGAGDLREKRPGIVTVYQSETTRHAHKTRTVCTRGKQRYLKYLNAQKVVTVYALETRRLAQNIHTVCAS